MTVAVLTGEGILRDTHTTGRAIRFLVLAATAVLGLSGHIDQPYAYWAITIGYGASILLPLVLGLRGPFVPGGIVMFMDVVAIGTLIILRGEQAQGLLVATFTLMLLAAVLEGLGTILLNAAIVSVGFMALTHWGQAASELLSLENTSQVALFFVVATLLGHVASQARLQAASRRSAERRSRRAQLALHDITTDLQQSEERLRKAQDSIRANERLWTLGMLAASVAHEIRNPLAAISAGVEVVGEVAEELRGATGRIDPRSVSDLRDVGRDCDDACSHLAQLASGLTDLSRVGVVRTDSVDLGTTIDIAARMLRRTAGPRVDIRVRTTAGRCAQADPGRILQVVLNLTKNAVDALAGREGATIMLSHSDDGPESVCLSVADNGPGVHEHVRATMFDAFVTTKQPGEGTGIGLHLVSEIVASHGGEVTYQPNRTGGALFRVRLPAATEPKKETVS